MRHFSAFIFRSTTILGTCCSCLFTGCDYEITRDVGSVQMLLDECDVLLEAREFERTQDKSMQAINKITPLIKTYNENLDYLLLRARAYLTHFFSNNSRIIENSPPRPHSLVPLPNKTEYIGYDPDITCAEADMRSIINRKLYMTKQQEAAVYATLAMTCRLDIDTLSQADLYYDRAIAANQSYLEEQYNQNNSRTVAPAAEYTTQRQKQQLQLAQIEVNLAAEKWSRALDLLNIMAGQQDLKYFVVQFEILENKLVDIQNKLREEFYLNAIKQSSKVQDMAQMQEGRAVDSAMLRATKGQTTYESELIRTETELTYLKNNLLYRIICFRNLMQESELQQALAILKRFYPEKEKQIIDALKITM